MLNSDFLRAGNELNEFWHRKWAFFMITIL